MNKFILRMMAIMIALTMSVGFVSCNDDDDNGNNGAGFPPALTGTVDQESGLRLKSFSSRELHYSDDGMLESVTASYDNMEDQFTFDYPANKIIET